MSQSEDAAGEGTDGVPVAPAAEPPIIQSIASGVGSIRTYASTVSSSTRNFVVQREGERCWLCGGGPAGILQAAHQLWESREEWFQEYKENNIVPDRLSSLAHPENLIALCPSCHVGYDTDESFWLMIPTVDTLDRYIQHERNDYLRRHRAGNRGVSEPRTLPDVDTGAVKYQPYILLPAFAELNFLAPSTWPKLWPGEPTTAILKAKRGLFQPCKPQRVHTRANEDLTTGVPPEIRIKVCRLVCLWSLPDPPVAENVQPPRKRARRDDGGAHGGVEGEGKGKAKAGGGTRQPVGASDRMLCSHEPKAETGPAGATAKVWDWLNQLPNP
ncbi:hypothetical protein BDZ91DRAFT_799151 [Kalaharituber pfeilii]|nr:hypothetical protein BDZ91DRAFT_799151 [Kalaharituber pfeilii]